MFIIKDVLVQIPRRGFNQRDSINNRNHFIYKGLIELSLYLLINNALAARLAPQLQ